MATRKGVNIWTPTIGDNADLVTDEKLLKHELFWERLVTL